MTPNHKRRRIIRFVEIGGPFLTALGVIFAATAVYYSAMQFASDKGIRAATLFALVSEQMESARDNDLESGRYLKSNLGHIRTLKEMAKMKIDLSNLYAFRVNLKNLKVHNTILDGADFGCARMSRAELIGARIHDGEFGGALLNQAKFNDAILVGADFQGSTLVGTEFVNADMTGANFQRTEIRNVSFVGSNVTEINFAESTMKNVDFTKVKEGTLTAQQVTLMCGTEVRLPSQFSSIHIGECTEDRIRRRKDEQKYCKEDFKSNRKGPN